jgi:hypothetical protein
MLLGIEIAMAVLGIAALASGRLRLSERSVVVGARARLLGFVAMIPGLLAAFFFLRFVFNDEVQPWLLMAQLGAIVGCAVAIYCLGLRWAVVTDPPSSG